MDLETLNPIIVPAIIALGGAIIGYFLKYYLDKKAQFASNNAELKRDAYQKFVNLTASFFIKSRKSQRVQGNSVEELSEFYKQYVLYGSPAVVRKFANLMQVFYKRETLGISNTDMTMAELKYILRSMTRVYKAMRKDIGLSNRMLGYGGSTLMRAIITDYDQTMRPRIIVRFSFLLISARHNWKRKELESLYSQEDNLTEKISSEPMAPQTPSKRRKTKINKGRR